MTDPNPYRPPQADITPAVPSSLEASGYAYVKDPKPLTSLLIVMLWISLSFEVISILGDAGQMMLLNNPYTDAQADANDMRQGLIGLGYLIVFIVTVVTFGKWIYRANVNSRGFGAQGMRFSPGWSVGYYFIPFINLVRPYQAMKEILQVSEDPREWALKNVPSVVGWWWTLWLISNFAGNIVFRLSAGAETVDDLKISTGVSIGASFVGIPLCLIAIKLVKTIAANQEELVQSSHDKMSAGSSPIDSIGIQ